ncbi:MAG: Ribosomal large subunit pseudouridine synthase B [Phycisphaerae bacterium]|nr:Ribosomal large subunit pseudouridine synthase B [Phycisphaerae bacterium]
MCYNRSAMSERLQKVMAAAGVGSRRACEEMIENGRVQVNGQLVSRLPVLVEAADRITVDGRHLRREKKVYFMLHKPRGVVCTNSDPAGRRRAVDLMKGVPERVFPVGRLDADSSGLLIMTNDGELSNRLTHPRYETAKTYEVQVDGRIEGPAMEKLIGGVRLAEGKASADRVKLVRRSRNETVLQITLTEGRNRQIRRMLAKVGYEARRLRRVKVGRLELRGVGPGNFRPLTAAEVAELRRSAGLS